MKKYLIIGIIVLAVLMIGGWAVGGYNKMIIAKRAIEGAWGQVQVVLQRRADLVPQLVSVVKGAAKFEKSTLENITAARSGLSQALQNGTRAEQVAAAQKFDSAFTQFRIQVEAYPQLTATAGYRDLQTQLEGNENRIAVERKRYNDAILEYNTLASVFPRNILARLFGFTLEKQYTASTSDATTAPKINLDL